MVPGVPADEPLDLTIAVGDQARRLRWYAWRPDGGAYDGLPTTAEEAQLRRAERVWWMEPVEPPPIADAVALATWTIDVRGLAEEAS